MPAENDIKACMACGSRNLSELGWQIQPTRATCRDCGFVGLPILFDSKADYDTFLEKAATSRRKRRMLASLFGRHKRPALALSGVLVLVITFVAYALIPEIFSPAGTVAWGISAVGVTLIILGLRTEK